jgi:hypothetical protein
MKKQIFIVFHGDVKPFSNPGLSQLGIEQIRNIKEAKVLPEQPLTIICGTGKRHIDTALSLGLAPTSYSALCGGPEVVNFNVRKDTVMLADGTIIPFEQWKTPSTWQFLADAPDQSIIVTGHDFIAGLKIDKTYHAASVLKIYVNNMDGGRQYIDVEILL